MVGFAGIGLSDIAAIPRDARKRHSEFDRKGDL
jgi:hypothetical protein